ncbi:hypothetical protein [Ancylobacter sp.]|uniref:hypothetical protein n=1 Tax=Ancylobacter sp. TaxID=1872567 RepID=UPI003C7EBCEC
MVWDLAEVLEQAGGDIGTPEFGRLCDRFGLRRGAQAALHLTSACLALPTPHGAAAGGSEHAASRRGRQSRAAPINAGGRAEP